jgi:ATP-dependent RNA helicase DeaD
MKRFRDRQIELLIATEVASRGLDVDDLEVVVNYELPHDPEDYVHRIGRTGRAGKSGKAISLIAGREYGRLQQVMRFTKTQIPRLQVPKIDEVEQKQAGRLVDSVKECLDAGDYKAQDELVEQILTEHTPNQVISALVHLLNQELARPLERIREDDPRQDRRAAPPQREQRGFEPREQREPRSFEQREPREQRPQRPAFNGPVNAVTEQNTAWVRLNVGRNVGLMPGDVVGCLAGESGLPREVIGAIRILPTLTLVQVASEHAHQIIQAVDGARIRNTAIRASEGTPPTPMGDERSGPSRRFGGREGTEGGDQQRGWDDAHRGGGFGGPPRRPFGGGGGRSYGPPRRSFGGGGQGGGEGGGGYDRPPPKRRFD